MENSNEKSKECCEKCNLGTKHCGIPDCICHKPSVEVSKCGDCGGEIKHQYKNTLDNVGGLACSQCGKDNFTLSPESTEPTQKDTSNCVDKDGTTQSTEMEEYENMIDKIISIVQDKNIPFHKNKFAEIDNLLTSHSQKLVSEINSKIEGLEIYQEKYYDKSIGSPKLEKSEVLDLINNIKI